MLASLAILLFAVSLPLLEPPVAVAAPGPSGSPAPAVIGRGRSVFAQGVENIRAFLRELYVSFFHSGRGPLVGVVLAILPQGAVALGLAFATTIPVDLGMSEERIALLSLSTSIAAALGCVVGGWVSDRVGHRASLAVWYGMTAVPTLYLALRLWGGTGVEGVTPNLYFAIAVTWSVASGLQYGTGNAVFMTLSSKSVAATQFTGYMALKNLALTYSNLWQGKVASLHGYSRALLLDGLFAIVPILVLPFVSAARRREAVEKSSI
jgi:MFS-type transporter involved in bile tolerance (Atg22 family)